MLDAVDVAHVEYLQQRDKNIKELQDIHPQVIKDKVKRKELLEQELAQINEELDEYISMLKAAYSRGFQSKVVRQTLG